jgi:hypothetical protein
MAMEWYTDTKMFEDSSYSIISKANAITVLMQNPKFFFEVDIGEPKPIVVSNKEAQKYISKEKATLIMFDDEENFRTLYDLRFNNGKAKK